MSAPPVTADTTVVLVTGANQGIGLEIVKKLAAEQPDYHIILSGRRPNAVSEAAAPLRAKGLRVSTLVLDITSDESIRAAVETVEAVFGRLDVLINNSAISGFDIEPLRERMRTVFDTNVVGTALVTNAFIPLLAKSSRTRRVVFVSSTLGSLALKSDVGLGFFARGSDFGAYTHSKAALNMLALHYAAEHEDDARWKFNIADPAHYCGTKLNGFQGPAAPELGAISACRLATIGADGETGTFTNDVGATVPF
ncbi:hypothetical protein B0J13DRAFT_430824 [Dactylonectria estremocensis]|uniref:Ketoreductase domain-containing protein n=1 Tax=Dactylonectria estremocensis TaxID=1079267 RepID=A0A9P9FJR6_9HYPO|nr:hypothetical protein B0J13DRAFT_430824 [Dactylonectria estremocensis]